MTISVEYHHNGMTLSTVAGDERIHRIYQGYSLKEAKALFKDYVKLSQEKGLQS